MTATIHPLHWWRQRKVRLARKAYDTARRQYIEAEARQDTRAMGHASIELRQANRALLQAEAMA